MTTPPIYNFRDLGSDAQMMSKNCANERMAMILSVRRPRFHDHHGRSRRQPRF